MKIKFLLYIFFALLVAACNTKDSDSNDSTVNDLSYVDDGDQDLWIAQINVELPELTCVKSLLYIHDDESTASSYAYLDKDENLIKIEEALFNSKTNSFEYRDFYFKDGKQFASSEKQQKELNNQPYFSEVVSFYNDKGDVIASKERTATFEEYLDNEGFKEVKKSAHNSDNAYAILRQEGPYKTQFRGFVEAGAYDFLIVGGPDEFGYTSALSIQEDSPTLRFLRKEGKKALGQDLRVSFERFTDNQGYEMQLLRDLAILKDN